MLEITGIALLSLLLISCSGTTAQIRVSDVNIERQDFALTPYQLGDINVSSKVKYFRIQQGTQNPTTVNR